MVNASCASRPTSAHVWQNILEQYGRPQSGEHGRRKETRYDVFATARVSSSGDDSRADAIVAQCNVTDISAHGMALRCPVEIASGTRVEIAVTLVGQTFQMAGTVANCIPGVGARRVGIELAFEEAPA